MSSRILTYDESEAKILIAISSLLWIVPIIYLVQLLLAYSGIGNVNWSGSDMTKVLIGVLWLVFALRSFRFVESELDKRRAFTIRREELQLKRKLSENK